MKNKIEETKALLEKVSGRKVSLVEKFAEPAKIDKDKKGMFKGDDGRSARMGSRDLDCILDRLGSAVCEKRLLGEFARGFSVQAHHAV